MAENAIEEDLPWVSRFDHTIIMQKLETMDRNYNKDY